MGNLDGVDSVRPVCEMVYGKDVKHGRFNIYPGGEHRTLLSASSEDYAELSLDDIDKILIGMGFGSAPSSIKRESWQEGATFFIPLLNEGDKLADMMLFRPWVMLESGVNSGGNFLSERFYTYYRVALFDHETWKAHAPSIILGIEKYMPLKPMVMENLEPKKSTIQEWSVDRDINEKLRKAYLGNKHLIDSCVNSLMQGRGLNFDVEDEQRFLEAMAVFMWRLQSKGGDLFLNTCYGNLCKEPLIKYIRVNKKSDNAARPGLYPPALT